MYIYIRLVCSKGKGQQQKEILSRERTNIDWTSFKRKGQRIFFGKEESTKLTNLLWTKTMLYILVDIYGQGDILGILITICRDNVYADNMIFFCWQHGKNRLFSLVYNSSTTYKDIFTLFQMACYKLMSTEVCV